MASEQPQRTARPQAEVVSIDKIRPLRSALVISESHLIVRKKLQDRVEALHAQSADARLRLRARRRSPSPDPNAGTWEWLITTRHACPNCTSETIQPSHRRNRFEFALSRIALPFFCNDCQARFFVSHI